MKKDRFIYGSIIMVIMNFIIGIIGFIYDIILSKFLGAEAMGLFQMAMSILMIFIIITTSGIPTALIKFIAEQNSRNNDYAVNKALKVTMLFNLFLSIILSLILILSGKFITLKIFKNEDMLFCVYLLSPVIIIISLNAIMRGYYYGMKNMIMPSIGQIIEHIMKFIIVLGFLYYVYPVEPVYGAMIAICGISIGELFDFIWISSAKKRRNRRHRGSENLPIKKINGITCLTQILLIAIPLTISNFFGILLRFMDTILIPNRLMILGYTNSEAVATFGRITGMTMPLVHLPFIVTSALVINLIPSLSEQVTLKNYRNMKSDIILAIKVTLLISIPLTVLYACLSEDLGLILYHDPKVGKFINIMGYSTVFLALQHTFSGILHGLNKQFNVTVNRLIGMILQILFIYFLVGNPKFGINGYFIGFFLSTFITIGLDFIVLKKMVKFKMDYVDLIGKPLAASAFMILSIYISTYYLSNIQNSNALIFTSSLIIGGISYIIALKITKAIPKNLLKKLIK